uniref:MHC class II alpha chain N-terminal domain-containing protein n=1 Tax=Myripristis murdjan TaxID=586833 RepID=A0A667WLJ5_9TELE
QDIRVTMAFLNLSSDAQYDLEYDGDELLYVDPVTYAIVQRLPEFAEQWTPDPQLPGDTYVSIGTCLYNIPTCIKGEKNPPEAIEVEVHTDHQVMETAVCVCGVLLGVMGVAAGVWFIRKANRSLSPL